MTIKQGEIKIGDRIKELRQKKELSYSDLSASSGISAIAIRKYESGERNPKVSTLKKIAGGLKITYEELVKDTDAVYVISLSSVKGALQSTLSNTPYADAIFLEMCKDTLKKEHISTEATFNKTVGINRNSTLNRALLKIRNGETLEPEEQQALDSFLQSGGFQRAFDSFSDSVKKFAENLKEYYELLNEEGQKKADKHIEYATEQIEMLTKIPEYQKKED